jgi:hypothetical protein
LVRVLSDVNVEVQAKMVSLGKKKKMVYSGMKFGGWVYVGYGVLFCPSPLVGVLL